MPYKKISELPETFNRLPDDAKTIAMNVINSCLEKGDAEESAIKQAWGAVKKLYQQDKDGNWAKIEKQAETKLETVNIDGVEMLAIGKWSGSKGETEITKEDLDNAVASFNELTANKKLNYEAPLKLGHNEKQKLLQEDGLPAAGWIKSIKKVGDKLVADIRDIPKKIGELMTAGAYKKRSAEFYRDYEIGGKKYPFVIKALALLGADIPAVKTISDIKALYTSEALKDESGADFQAVYFEESMDQKTRNIRDAYRKQTRPADSLVPSPEPYSWVREVYESYVIVEKGDVIYKVAYTETNGEYTFDLANAVKVEMTYQPVTPSGKPEANDNQSEKLDQEANMEKEIRTLLVLDEKADVLEAVKALKAKADQSNVSLAETEDLKKKVTGLETQLTESQKAEKTSATKLAELQRDNRVNGAITAGKITPAQKKWAEEYALKDPAGFDAFVAGAPVVVKLGEIGNGGDDVPKTQDGKPVELTEVEKKLATQLGVTEEQLIKTKQAEAAKAAKK